LIPDAEEFLGIHREDVINHLWIFKQALVNSSLLVAPFGGAAMDVMEPDDHFETSTLGESACVLFFYRSLGCKGVPYIAGAGENDEMVSSMQFDVMLTNQHGMTVLLTSIKTTLEAQTAKLDAIQTTMQSMATQMEAMQVTQAAMQATQAAMQATQATQQEVLNAMLDRLTKKD
jgi:hypothetical protein